MKKLTFLLFVALLAVMSPAAITYVDADHNTNTNFAPSAGGGALIVNSTDTVDGIWRFRTGFGLSPTDSALPTSPVATGGSGTVYESTGNTATGDDVPRVVTTVSGLAPNAYDVYVYFWSDQHNSPWRIRAGLEDTIDPLPLFIGGGDPSGDPIPVLIQRDNDDRKLWQAYLGQVSGTSISVFVEDAPAENGNQRTWYDGIGYEVAYNQPSCPLVTPVNENGTVGRLVNDNTRAEVTLHFNAGADPNGYPVNPKILTHYIYLSAPNDPNIPTVPLDAINQVHNPDPMLTDPANSYGPIILAINATYYWQVEEGVDKGDGTARSAGDPNNFIGPVWSFTTTGPECTINPVTPELVAVAAGSNVQLNVIGANVDDYQWYKIDSPVDIMLANDSKYSGVTTDQLTITNVQLSDEGLYYCVVSNEVNTASNRDSGPGRVMIARLVNHYPMEVIIGNTTPDVVGGADMTLLTNGTMLPSLAAGVVGSSSLSLDPAAEPSGQYGQLPAGVLDYTDFTLTAWVNWKYVSGWQRIFDFGNSTTQRVTLTPSAWGSSTSFTIVNVTEQGIGTGSLLPNNQWVHVAVSIGGNTGRLYINGVRVGINRGMTHDPIDFKPALNYIGKSLDTSEPYFHGLIDDLKIYNYALSNTEVAREYIAVRGGWICDVEGTDSLLYDFNNDCRVDLADFARFVIEWLHDNRIY